MIGNDTIKKKSQKRIGMTHVLTADSPTKHVVDANGT